MKKQAILTRICRVANKGKRGQEKVDREQVERVIEAFKQVMLEDIEKGKDFNYRGFIEVETSVVQARERVNPKTQEPLLLHKGYKVNVRLAYSIRQFIKSIVVK